MDFIDDINSITSTKWCKLHIFSQFTHIIHARIRGAVNFNDVLMSSFTHGKAAIALSTRFAMAWKIRSRSPLTVIAGGGSSTSSCPAASATGP